MKNEKTFRTKTGFCHVTADKIILTRDGAVGNLSKVIVGNTIWRIVIIYGIISVGLIYFAYESYVIGDIATALPLGLIAFYFVYGIVKSLNNSATPVIERKDILRVTYHAGTSGLTRPRFVVEFTDNGRTKKRLIPLPGSLSGGQSEADKAVEIMKSAKLLN